MTIKWGILATGSIAHKLAKAIGDSTTGELIAVGSRSQDGADAFAKRWNGITAYPTYEELLRDSRVDAVYVATPHPQHAQWTIKALEGGKAVLCEKPMGLNHAEVMAMVHTASQCERFLLEAFMYRLHPQTLKLGELVHSGAIGELRHIHATFGFRVPFNASSRLYAAELGGGGIMDVGCYPVSMCRFLAQREPVSVYAVGQLAETGADAYSSALLDFGDGVGAHIATGVGQQLDNVVRVFGDQGRVTVRQPWLCPEEWQLELTQGGESQIIKGKAHSPYVYEVDEVAKRLSAGELQSPTMSWDDSLGNSRVLDNWRSAIGVIYPQEKPESLSQPVHSRPLVPMSDTMLYGSITGLDKPVSRLVMGCDNQPTLTHAATMFDHFYDHGGTTFDTAYIYGGGRIETYLGHWLRQRDLRDKVTIIGKGAHTPLNFPDRIKPQLEESLSRLQSEHIDIYFLHRDNLDVPVGEWIDALNEVKDEGLITVFGGSNWSAERAVAAIDYAKANGKTPFAAISNQFSLAEMLDPVWPGCISANTAEYKRILTDQELALLPWSSQARGFFTSRYDSIVEKQSTNKNLRVGLHPSDQEMQRCWFAESNFARRERAVQLAEQRGVGVIHIALAYVLNQPFATFALIGPRDLNETSSSLKALELDLSPEEIEWLESGES